ncbi:MAG: indolepyruvate ferredoxin oxidoreductase subunit alpha [Bdellovibrionia bacterium]
MKTQKKPEEEKPISYLINQKCTLCGLCVEICPTQSIFLGKTQYLIDSSTCDIHGVCLKICPADAIIPMYSQKKIK